MDELALLRDFRLEDAAADGAREHARAALQRGDDAPRISLPRRRYALVLAFALAAVLAAAAYAIVHEFVIGSTAPKDVQDQIGMRIAVARFQRHSVRGTGPAQARRSRSRRCCGADARRACLPAPVEGPGRRWLSVSLVHARAGAEGRADHERQLRVRQATPRAHVRLRLRLDRRPRSIRSTSCKATRPARRESGSASASSRRRTAGSSRCTAGRRS